MRSYRVPPAATPAVRPSRVAAPVGPPDFLRRGPGLSAGVEWAADAERAGV